MFAFVCFDGWFECDALEGEVFKVTGSGIPSSLAFWLQLTALFFLCFLSSQFLHSRIAGVGFGVVSNSTSKEV